MEVREEDREPSTEVGGEDRGPAIKGAEHGGKGTFHERAGHWEKGPSTEGSEEGDRDPPIEEASRDYGPSIKVSGQEGQGPSMEAAGQGHRQPPVIGSAVVGGDLPCRGMARGQGLYGGESAGRTVHPPWRGQGIEDRGPSMEGAGQGQGFSMELRGPEETVHTPLGAGQGGRDPPQRERCRRTGN